MQPRLLTKSRFKLALECPNKLYYTRKEEYANAKKEDAFLEALAQGGFQVEELARLEYPQGILIEGNDGDYDWLVSETDKLLQRENVVIFEAAFKHENLFIRTDILVKRGNKVQLIEVKAKSFDPEDEYIFIGKRGGMVSGWKPYLFDVAFQKYVMQKCRPQWKISSWLMMADKSKAAEIDGLNQLFRVTKNANNRTGIVKKVESLEQIGSSVLGKIKVDNEIAGIESGRYRIYEDLEFKDCISKFASSYEKDEFYAFPPSFSSCKACEFRTTEEQEAEGKRSGYKECWTQLNSWTETHFSQPNIFEVWNFRAGSKLFEEGKILLEDLEETDLKTKPEPGKISASERQWVQIEKAVNGDKQALILREELAAEMSTWKYPLNFIDFETSAAALPFNKGLHPYEQVAFQFSHHTMDETGKVKHASQYINFEPGKFPNFKFVRELKKALSKNNGSIFRYAPHENTILNAIYVQLEESSEPDKRELQEFIQCITHSTGGSAEKWCGERDMIDLWDLVKKYYYDPHTKGSNSIKAVLPAVLHSSALLRKKYSRPLEEIGLSSRNFDGAHIWLKIEEENVLSPYKMLPPLFEDWSEEELDATVSEMENIADGGAALTAYGKLQYTDMPLEERLELKNSLLKYCELDTLAMVMIVEFFREEIS